MSKLDNDAKRVAKICMELFTISFSLKNLLLWLCDIVHVCEDELFVAFCSMECCYTHNTCICFLSVVKKKGK